MERKILQVSYMKYPDATQLVRLLKFRAFPMVERATARVVWSMRATKSTVAQARNIWMAVSYVLEGIRVNKSMKCSNSIISNS